MISILSGRSIAGITARAIVLLLFLLLPSLLALLTLLIPTASVLLVSIRVVPAIVASTVPSISASIRGGRR